MPCSGAARLYRQLGFEVRHRAITQQIEVASQSRNGQSPILDTSTATDNS